MEQTQGPIAPPKSLLPEVVQPTVQGGQSQPQDSSQALQKASKEELSIWNPQQLDLLKRTLAKDLDNDEFALFVNVCKLRRLNPFAKQVYGLKRQGKLVIVTAIDGYRLIAERTGKYLGQTAPFWCGKDGTWKDVWLGPGNPHAVKLGVHKERQVEPTWAVAYWDNYVAPGPFWTKSGASQLAKCCEGLALRKAFPEELSGIYTMEEMEQAGNSAVEAINVPSEPELAQPVLIFPTEVKQSWATEGEPFCLFLDEKGREWIAAGHKFFDIIDKAISDSTHILVYFAVDTGRRVVTAIQE